MNSKKIGLGVLFFVAIQIANCFLWKKNGELDECLRFYQKFDKILDKVNKDKEEAIKEKDSKKLDVVTGELQALNKILIEMSNNYK